MAVLNSPVRLPLALCHVCLAKVHSKRRDTVSKPLEICTRRLTFHSRHFVSARLELILGVFRTLQHFGVLDGRESNIIMRPLRVDIFNVGLSRISCFDVPGEVKQPQTVDMLLVFGWNSHPRR